MIARYYEDYTIGEIIRAPGVTLTEAEIIHFALTYDPQPFHIDALAAKENIYGGLIASGWQVAVVAFRMLVQAGMVGSASLGSPGLEELRWILPVRPGDTIYPYARITAARVSASKPDRGLVKAEWWVENQRKEIVAKFISTQLVRRRPKDTNADPLGPVPGIAKHYERRGVYESIMAALKEAGKDLDHLTPEDLAPVDQFHTRGHAVTLEMTAALGLKGGERVLDIGSGIGGPSRWLAKTKGCQISGVDLSAEFVRTAIALSRLLKLDALTDYRQGTALDLPFPDASFDAAWCQNVSMNLSDRAHFYQGVRRVLKPGGRFAFADIVALSGEPLHYPVPWASAPEGSFLKTAAETRTFIEAAGFRIVEWVDTTSQAIGAQRDRASQASAPPLLALHHVMGPDFGTKVTNSSRNFAEGKIGALQAVVERVG